VHAKAMPVLLLTDADIETWLTVDEALQLQKPAPDDEIVVLPEKKKAAYRLAITGSKRPCCRDAMELA
jgi:putative SOS response-associated peptidase YedK